MSDEAIRMMKKCECSEGVGNSEQQWALNLGQ